MRKLASRAIAMAAGSGRRSGRSEIAVPRARLTTSVVSRLGEHYIGQSEAHGHRNAIRWCRLNLLGYFVAEHLPAYLLDRGERGYPK